ncbi:hypothetical protein GOODEAATRI_014613 [Goodea atripinnis]|uniref:Uncharacterized protein n=1 Tax=Goodea atripinnis TaxID=208336 RepID=A0ABV0NUJ9_9TELE
MGKTHSCPTFNLLMLLQHFNLKFFPHDAIYFVRWTSSSCSKHLPCTTRPPLLFLMDFMAHEKVLMLQTLLQQSPAVLLLVFLYFRVSIVNKDTVSITFLIGLHLNTGMVIPSGKECRPL